MEEIADSNSRSRMAAVFVSAEDVGFSTDLAAIKLNWSASILGSDVSGVWENSQMLNIGKKSSAITGFIYFGLDLHAGHDHTKKIFLLQGI
jgi:hypothetical protein